MIATPMAAGLQLPQLDSGGASADADLGPQCSAKILLLGDQICKMTNILHKQGKFLKLPFFLHLDTFLYMDISARSVIF